MNTTVTILLFTLLIVFMMISCIMDYIHSQKLKQIQCEIQRMKENNTLDNLSDEINEMIKEAIKNPPVIEKK